MPLQFSQDNSRLNNQQSYVNPQFYPSNSFVNMPHVDAYSQPNLFSPPLRPITDNNPSAFLPQMPFLVPPQPSPVGSSLSVPYTASSVAYGKKPTTALGLQLLKALFIRKFMNENQTPEMKNRLSEYPNVLHYEASVQPVDTDLQLQASRSISNEPLIARMGPLTTSLPSIVMSNFKATSAKKASFVHSPTFNPIITITKTSSHRKQTSLKHSPTIKMTTATNDYVNTLISKPTRSRTNGEKRKLTSGTKKYPSNIKSNYLSPILRHLTTVSSNVNRRHLYETEDTIAIKDNDVTERGVAKKVNNGIVIIPFGAFGYMKESRYNSDSKPMLQYGKG